jgi:hypothetical protein
LVVIWTLASELSSPSTVAMSRATHDALGATSEVRTEAAPPGDGLRPQSLAQVSGWVRVSWDSAEHRRARLLCYLPALDRWIDREVAFSPSDPESERGRTLGFLVASIFIDAGVVPPSSERGVRVSPPPAAPSTPPPTIEDEPSEPSKPRLTSLGAAAEVTGPGTATGFGAWLAVERSVLGSELWLGGAARARFGSVSEAQATSRLLALGFQATWLAWTPSSKSRVGVRGGASVAQLSMAHLSDDDAGVPEAQSRFLAVFELVLHSRYHFAPASALAVDLGAQVLSGKTEIYVHQRRVGTWPHAVPVLRLGVESTF